VKEWLDTCLFKVLAQKNMFITCAGPGFVNKKCGDSTGPLLDLAINAGAFILENPKPEEVKQKITRLD
jgi:hypothetical protein